MNKQETDAPGKALIGQNIYTVNKKLFPFTNYMTEMNKA